MSNITTNPAITYTNFRNLKLISLLAEMSNKFHPSLKRQLRHILGFHFIQKQY